MLRTRNADTRTAPPHRNSDLAAQHDISCLLTTPCTRCFPAVPKPPDSLLKSKLRAASSGRETRNGWFTWDYNKKTGAVWDWRNSARWRRKPQKLKLDSREKCGSG